MDRHAASLNTFPLEAAEDVNGCGCRRAVGRAEAPVVFLFAGDGDRCLHALVHVEAPSPPTPGGVVNISLGGRPTRTRFAGSVDREQLTYKLPCAKRPSKHTFTKWSIVRDWHLWMVRP